MMNPVLIPLFVLLLTGCASTSSPTRQLRITPEGDDFATRREVIEPVIKKRSDDFLDCFRSLQKRAPVSHLDFTPEFKIGSTGKVILSRVHETTTRDPSFQACMLTIVNQLKFSKLSAATTVRYPFAFKKE